MSESASAPADTTAPELFCARCIFYTGAECAIGKVAEGADIATVSDCNHREFPPAPETEGAGDPPPSTTQTPPDPPAEDAAASAAQPSTDHSNPDPHTEDRAGDAPATGATE